VKKLKQLWQNPRRYVKPLIVTIALLLGIHGISLWVGGGKVIDEETRKPLEGVFVMAQWNASAFNPVDSRTVCYNFAITQTDKEGRYYLSSLSWNLLPWLIDRQRYVEYYLPGYEGSPNNKVDIGLWKLRRSTKTAEERLKRLTSIGYRESCVPEGERKEKLGPLYRAQYEEAKRIATSSAEKKFADAIKYLRDSVELPYDAVHRNSDGSLKQ
jgi:hypothetical protein